MPIDISAVIPTLNRKKILRRVIEALLEQTYPKDRYEIVIVDDGSTDGTHDMVKSLPGRTPAVIYVRQSHLKRGPASANNLGIKTAAGEYILFMNDDVIADKKLIEEHMKTHAVFPGKDIIVQGRVINTSSLEEPGKKHEGYSGGYSDLSFGYFTTWNCSVKKSVLEKAGLFDEDFVDLCWEDVEFGYRLRRNGIRQKYNKNAFGYHFRHEFRLDHLDWVRKKSIAMGKNAMIYYRKHPVLEVKISTESFWLPMMLQTLLGSLIRMIGSRRISDYMKSIERKKRTRLLSFLVGLAGKYWYWTGVKESKS